MGLFSWFRGSPKGDSKPTQPAASKTSSSPSPNTSPSPQTSVSAVPGMNGAVEVPRMPSPEDVTVFEFGSLTASSDRVTLAGYCPVSEELEPCRWLIVPASEADAPQFRVVF